MEKPKGANFDRLVMTMMNDNWKVETQMGDTVVLEKNVGVNGWIGGIIILLFSLVGTIGVLIWIAVGGKKKVTLRRDETDYLADVTTKDFSTRINQPYDLQPFLQKMQSGFRLGYGAAIGLGVVSFILNFVILSAIQ